MPDRDIDIKKVYQKLNKFLDFPYYKDFLLLDFDGCMAKYGHYGNPISKYFAIRFADSKDTVREISGFLPEEHQYFIIPIIRDDDTVYIKDKKEVAIFLEEKNFKDFIIMEDKMHWVLIKDEFNTLKGIGNYIIKEMKTNITTRFGDSIIKHAHTDLVKTKHNLGNDKYNRSNR